MTNKKDWDQFVRSKERYKVHTYFQSNKVELFNLWLDNEKDWDTTKIQVERIQSQSNEAKKGWYSIQGKELKQKYSPEKAKSIIASRVQNSLYYDCDDFPGDEDDTRLKNSMFSVCF